MKIGFITFEYPPVEIGGAGVYALHITRELARLGHEVHVISPSVNGREAYSVENDVFVRRIPVMRKRFLNAPSFWFNLARKYSKIRKDVGGFDVLHGNDVSDFSLSKWQVKEPRVVTIHHLAYLVAQVTSPLKRLLDISGETAFTPFIQKIVVSRADKIIAVSNFTKKTLVSYERIHSSVVEVIPNGINMEDYEFSQEEIFRFRKSIGLDDHVAFLFVGRLNDPRKNVLLLLKAFKLLCEKHKKPVKLVLVGSGNQLKFKEIVDSFGIGQSVIFLGHVKDEILRKCYVACDVLVSPSLLEGFGLTILEAMAAGKPVIALNRGAVSELVKNSVSGFIINKPDPQEFANVMAFLVDNTDVIKSIGERNKEYVAKNYSWKKSAKLTESVYKSLLG